MDAASSKIIFFDGDCGLCNGILRWIKNKKRSSVFQFIPLQHLKNKNDSQFKIPLPKDYDGIIFMTHDIVYLKSNAVFRILFELHPLWKMLQPLLWLPTWFRDFFYDLIARNRHYFFKGANYCERES